MLNLDEISKFYPANLKSFGTNILREYLQCKILEIIFDSQASQKFAFIGGTALRIAYGALRFSEDLDFDLFGLTQMEFQQLIDSIQKSLVLEGFNVESNCNILSDKGLHAKINFLDILHKNKLSPHKNSKLLIKIEGENKKVLYMPQKFLLNKFEVLTQINVAPLDILLSMKINAILNRKRKLGRDFFDVSHLFSQTIPSYRYLKSTCNIGNPSELKTKLLEVCQGLDWDSLSKDLEAFVFNPKDLKRIILFEELIKKEL